MLMKAGRVQAAVIGAFLHSKYVRAKFTSRRILDPEIAVFEERPQTFS